MLPYLSLAIAIIVAYRVIGEFDNFLALIGQMWGIVTPFFHGFLLAYVLNLPCSGIQKLAGKSSFTFVRKRKKAIGIISAYVLFFFVLFLVSSLIVPSIYSSIILFIDNFQTYYYNTWRIIDYIGETEIFGLQVTVAELLSERFSADEMMSFLQDLTAENRLVNFFVGIFSAIFRGFLAFISSIYILVEKENFKAFLKRLLMALSPKSVYAPILKYADALNQNFKQYIHTQTIDGLILGTVATIQLHLLRSPYALLLGVMLGVFNYIPYFGSIVATIIAILIVTFTQGATAGAITTIVLLITQQIDANVIQPKLLGGSFSLSPLLVIVCISIGGFYAGVLGMVAAIPIVAVLKNILNNIMTYYEEKKMAEAE